MRNIIHSLFGRRGATLTSTTYKVVEGRTVLESGFASRSDANEVRDDRRRRGWKDAQVWRSVETTSSVDYPERDR